MWAQKGKCGPKRANVGPKGPKTLTLRRQKNEGSGLLESHHFQKIFKKF